MSEPIAGVATRSKQRSLTAGIVAATLAWSLAAWGPKAAPAEDLPTEITGKAILDHPAGKALMEAAKLLRAGKLAEVKKASVREVREEWATLSAADQREEAERLRERAPEPKVLAAEIARAGVFTFYGDTVKFSASSADGNQAIMAFVALEEGKWRVTGGPFTVDTTPVVETAPALEGAEILDHEIGRMALAYAQQIEMGEFEGAMEFATTAARAKRQAQSAQERAESDTFSKSFWPAQALLKEQIQKSARVTFEGESAYLIINTNVQTTDADGTMHITSTSYTVPFGLEDGTWRVAN